MQNFELASMNQGGQYVLSRENKSSQWEPSQMGYQGGKVFQGKRH